MHSSKTLIKCIAFCIVLVLCSAFMTFILYPWSSLNRHFLGYHNETENIDFLILGNSLENNGINPKIISEEFNCHAYKFTPQGSYPESLYYLLIDVLSTHNVKTLLVGWDIIQNFQNPPYIYPHSEELYREFIVDFPKSWELTCLTLKNIMAQRYTSTFFKWSSFPENILEIPDVLKSKQNKDCTTPNTTAEILSNKPENPKFPADFNKVVYERKYTPVIQPNDKEYLLKIKQRCKKENIRLYVLSCAIPESIQKALPEMADFIKISADFMKENDITYINTSDSIHFPGGTDDYNFKDCFGHYNAWYMNTYTQQICNFIKSANDRTD
ncbi:MAG: hypothetical protein HDR37_12380 [Treponema sp.]|nr:hypothetical protein [Treponema sp.]